MVKRKSDILTDENTRPHEQMPLFFRNFKITKNNSNHQKKVTISVLKVADCKSGTKDGFEQPVNN